MDYMHVPTACERVGSTTSFKTGSCYSLNATILHFLLADYQQLRCNSVFIVTVYLRNFLHRYVS